MEKEKKEIHRFALNDRRNALNDKGSALNAPSCHSEHREESHLEKDKKEIHRFALNDRRNALNDKGSALNDPPCHSEHREESHLEKDKKEIHRFALNDKGNDLNEKKKYNKNMRPSGTHNYYVYILTNKNKKVLYTGVTNDLKNRLYFHCNPKPFSKAFTARYKCFYLVYYERYSDIYHAISREKQIKGLSREKKEKMITEFNKQWSFLNDEI
ncbi:GIY-YIG nuclease family protein [Tannerella forsythia]|uniref:GIY-YIG nuclease family protein n=1 Tax=Tannerella forsythia TaxID=28112 RepID=UPI001E419B3E|nr:GIY-YIG nuclease family protein [Tannerella forsythia]